MPIAHLLPASGLQQLLARILPDCLQHLVACLYTLLTVGNDEGFVDELGEQI